MKRILALLASAYLANVAQTCCITYADLISLAKESAIIVWDPTLKIEHFIRRAEFSGKGKDFGFIFPSPSEPFRIEVVDESIFRELLKHKPRPMQLGCGMKSERPASASSDGGIQILQDKTVGDYQVIVLKATDGNAMSDWIRKNGHKYRPAMTPWFDYYAKKKWYFTAFKYKGLGGETPTRAVSISFKIEKPFYPYKMPSDTFPEGHYRPLDLIVLSTSSLSGRYTNGKQWKSEMEWHAVIPPSDHGNIQRLIENEKSSIALPNPLVITRYKSPEGMENYGFEFDVEFSPIMVIQWHLIGSGVLVGIVIFWMMRRIRVRRSMN